MKRTVLLTVLMGLGLLTVGGCNTRNISDGISEKMEDIFPPSGPERVQMAFVSPDPDVRRKGVRLLSQDEWGRKESYQKGYANLVNSDPDPSVRAAAVLALGKCRNPEHLDTIIHALGDKNELVRWDAVRALQMVQGPEAVNPLQKVALEDESANVRAGAVKALRNYPRKEVVRALIDTLGDKDFAVRYHSRRSLQMLTGRDYGYNRRAWLRQDNLPVREATAESKDKPWWDLLGVTG
ncbi:MAG: HEAT repeat domain-containing protein [Phycisphaerae bacterium]